MDHEKEKPFVAVVGGGPAGLMAAEALSLAGVRVDVYDAMPSVGRKFLMAGKGGMNITHSEPFPLFLSRYGEREADLAPLLTEFGPTELRDWAKSLGVETFVGTSGRVFPVDMKAAPLLRAWLHRLKSAGVNFRMRHRFTGWREDGSLVFSTPEGDSTVRADAAIFALGGGSYPQLGSTGDWVGLFCARGVEVRELVPANSGFEARWSEHFKARFSGSPLKTVALCLDGKRQIGEFVVTDSGVEGSLIYAFSSQIRRKIAENGEAKLEIDLCPAKDFARLAADLAKPRGTKTLANHLRAHAKIDGVKAGLLRELAPESLQSPEHIARALKALPLTLTGCRPLSEAISSAGGIPFSELDGHLMLKKFPGTFAAGEMLDWEAPTGGYLLTACFASGRAAGEGALAFLKSTNRDAGR